MSDDDLIRRGDALQLVQDYETIHDRISLLPAALPARGVGVKPLVWELATTMYEPCEAYQAICAVGVYVVAQDEDSPCQFTVEYGVGPDTFHKGQPLLLNVVRSLDAAKAAAQADYEARILAALSPAAQPGADVAAQAREEVAWQSTTEAFIPFVTDERYRKFSPEVQKHYVPYRCPSCAPAAQAREAALAVLAGLSSYLGTGLGDDDTTAEQFDKRIRWAIDDLTARTRQAALREAAAAVRARYMGDNNREDMKVLRCEAAILALIVEAHA